MEKEHYSRIAENFPRVYNYAEKSLLKRMPFWDVPGLEHQLVERAEMITVHVVYLCKAYNLGLADSRGHINVDILQCLIAKDVDYSFVDCYVESYIAQLLSRKPVCAK